MAKTAVPNTSAPTNNWTPTHDEIAAQAYQIYLREGCAEGRDLDHWLRAESELRERATQNGNANGAATAGNSASNGNGGADERATAAESDAGNSDPRSKRQNSPLLTNSVIPPSAPIAEVSRTTTTRKSSGKREAAAAK